MGVFAGRRVWCALGKAVRGATGGLSFRSAARRPARWLILAGTALCAGCWGTPAPPKAQAPSFRGVSLRVGAVDDAGILTGVSLLRGEWGASRGGEVVMIDKPVAAEAALGADVVIFPGERLGDLVDADALAVIPNSAVMPAKPAESEPGELAMPESSAGTEQGNEAFEYMDFIPAFRDEVGCYGEDRFALPCGTSALVLAYRRDAFEREGNRVAVRGAGLELKPPKTWTELDALARFFEGRDWNGDGKPQHGIVLALGADSKTSEGIGEAVFLARAASLGQHRDHFSFLFDSDAFAPRVDSPPFVEALKGLVAWKAVGPPGVLGFDATAAREAFRQGRATMLIDLAEQAASWSGGKPVGVASLPGSERVYEPMRKEWKPASPANRPSYLPHGGGWLIGISKDTAGTQREAALDFAKYLASADNLNRLRRAEFPDAAGAHQRARARAAGPDRGAGCGFAAVDAGRHRHAQARAGGARAAGTRCGRLPERDLEGPAGGAVRGGPGAGASSRGEGARRANQSPGPERQLWHYRRSLNKLVTMPKPPEPGK